MVRPCTIAPPPPSPPQPPCSPPPQWPIHIHGTHSRNCLVGLCKNRKPDMTAHEYDCWEPHDMLVHCFNGQWSSARSAWFCLTWGGGTSVVGWGGACHCYAISFRFLLFVYCISIVFSILIALYYYYYHVNILLLYHINILYYMIVLLCYYILLFYIIALFY